jgi:hypothetical protein
MSSSKVVNRRFEQFDIYIGRGSKWGNPFKIGIDGTREEVILKYESYLSNTPELLKSIPELSGKRLGCYCAPQKCHGDVLAELANKPKENRMSSSNNPNRYRPLAALTILRAIQTVNPSELIVTCLSCDNFVESSEGCKLSNMMRPPARVIAFGCANYDNLDQDIPF